MSSRNACQRAARLGSARPGGRSAGFRSVVGAALLGFGLLSWPLAEPAAAARSASGTADVARARADEASEPIRLAQSGGTEPRELEPRYPAPPPGEPGPYSEEGAGYNSDYIFGMTRGVAHSTMVPAAKAPLFLLTVPLDIVLLPFTVIGGFFG